MIYSGSVLRQVGGEEMAEMYCHVHSRGMFVLEEDEALDLTDSSLFGAVG